VPLEAGAPQSFDASYAPAFNAKLPVVFGLSAILSFSKWMDRWMDQLYLKTH
jgi:hypothetical protein